MKNKTVLRIFKAVFPHSKDQECYMIIEGNAVLPEIDQSRYDFDYHINTSDGYIHLCWLEVS